MKYPPHRFVFYVFYVFIYGRCVYCGKYFCKLDKDCPECSTRPTEPKDKVSPTPPASCQVHNGRVHNKISTKILVGVLTFFITITVSTVLFRIFFRPTRPEFVLEGITVNSFDLPTPNVIRANLRVTISSRNPNSIIRLDLDRIEIYITYRNQPITNPTALYPIDQGHNAIYFWTANVSGPPVSLEPNNAIALCQEQASGSVRVTIKIVGRMRWKIGSLTIGKHKFSVKCWASIHLSQQTEIVVKKCSVRL